MYPHPRIWQQLRRGLCLGLVFCLCSSLAWATWEVAPSVDPSGTLADLRQRGDGFQPLDSAWNVEEEGVYWVRCRDLPPVTAPQRWVLWLGHLPKGELYLLSGDQLVARESFGTLRPPGKDSAWLEHGLYHEEWGYSEQRQLWRRPGDSLVIYVRISQEIDLSYPLQPRLLPWEAWLQWRLSEQEQAFINWQSLFQGALWALLLYHLLIFLIYLDSSFLLYAIYLLAISLTFGDHYPAGREALLGSTPWLGKFLLDSVDVVAGLLFFAFNRRFIRLDELNPRWDRLAYWTLVIGGVGWAVVYLPYLWRFSYPMKFLGTALTIPGQVLCIYLAVKLAKLPNTLIRYTMAGGAVMILATLVNAVMVTGERLGGWAVDMQVRILFTEGAVLVQAFIFAMGLGYRMRQGERQKHQLAELSRLKSRFFADVSHEFRTPLTLILGPAQALADEGASESVREQGGLILRNARRLLRLVNQILDLAKVEANRVELQRLPHELGDCLRQAVAAFQSHAEAQGVNLRLTCPDEPLIAELDADKMEQVLTNLLSNALRHTPAGGEVRVVLARKARDRAEIFVRDTGAGIDPAHLPHLFDRFYQAPSEGYTTDQPSTGIGLALTREWIALHGGEIEVQSQLGGGSTFSFWLPLSAQQEALAASGWRPYVPHWPVQADRGELGKDPKTESTTTLLLVEDNPDVRLYLRRCLGRAYRLLEAGDGEEGLALARSVGPDLVITDVMMPRRDGLSLTQALKADPATSHLPVVVLTGKSSQESKLEGLSQQADEYLSKPFDARELRLRIQGLLANRRRWQQRYSQQLLLDETPVELPDREGEWLQKAIALTTQHMGEEDFSVVRLADLMALDRTQLFRKLKALTDQSPSQFISTCRLRQAKQLIEAGEGTLTDIAYAVGFSSPAYFSRVFKQHYGRPPGDFRPAT